MTRDDILNALSAFANQRPGFDPANYGDAASYRSDTRRATRQLHDFRTLMTAVRWRQSIDVDQLKAAFRAFSGRLTLTETKRGARLEYCTGQYFPTEFRAACCAVLASALWDWLRSSAMPAPHQNKDGMDRYRMAWNGRDADNPGDYIRAAFRHEFGRQIQQRWFN